MFGSFRLVPHHYLLLALLLTVMVIAGFHQDFFRAYTDTRQSSLASAHMHSFAWGAADFKGMLNFLFVAKNLNLADGTTVDYTHYTNGYPLLVRGYFALVGDTLFTARLFPLLAILTGGLLFLSSIPNAGGRLYLALPLFLLTALARDAASFELLEPAHFLAIGLAAFFIYRPVARPCYVAQVLTVFASVVLYQVSAVFVLALVGAAFLRDRNWKVLLACGTGFALAGGGMVWAMIDSGGWDKFASIVLHRTGLVSDHGPAYNESVSWPFLAGQSAFRMGHNFGPFLLLGAGQALLMLRQRVYALPVVAIGFIIYCGVLRNHVGMHLFTFLPGIFFMTCLIALALFAAYDRAAAAPRMLWRRSVVALALSAVVYIGVQPRTYNSHEDASPGLDVERIDRLATSGQFDGCDFFVVDGLETDYRMAAYEFPKRVNPAGAVRCHVDVRAGLVSRSTEGFAE